MSRIIIAILALSIGTTLLTAESKTYAGVGVVMETVEEIESDITVDLKAGVAVEAKGGISFENSFGVESRVTNSIIGAKGSEVFGNRKLTTEADVTTLSLFGTYTYQLIPKFAIIPKVGLTYAMIDLDIELGDEKLEGDDDTDLSFSYGVEAQYSLTSTTDLYVGYTIYNIEFNGEKFDASHLSIGIQKNF